MNARFLEIRIPPPIVALTIAALMWFTAGSLPRLDLLASARHIAAAFIAAIGLSLAIAGIARFRRAQTTVNPMRPEQASVLLTDGIFRYTRNPMYLSLLLILISYAVLLSSPLALAGPVAFFVYINRFQITPEERALEAKFGSAYVDYRRRVRRWL